MNELAIAVGVILFPGLITAVICDKITVHSPRWGSFKYSVYSFIFGVSCYVALQGLAYAKLALPAIQGAGGRYLARGMPVKTYEAGLDQRTVIIEFDSAAQAIAAHDSPAYQTALKALDNTAKRDVRIIEGVG